MRYWLDTFNEETWAEFVAAGSSISGFPARQAKTANRLQKGDVLICYITGKKVFNAILKVVGNPSTDTKRIWKSGTFPIRVPVEVSLSIPIEHAVVVDSLKDKLTWFRELKSPSSWTFRIRNTPYEISNFDAAIILEAVKNASNSPKPSIKADNKQPALKPSHEAIQWLLLSLGDAMGLSVRPANNDVNKSYNGNGFADLKGFRKALPVQFDSRTQRIIEHIDVLWLQGSSIRAAFEIEHTTSVYSGLLRMSDLITLQPNININLFVVAPDERRDKVRTEINRPTFANARLPRECRYISYSKLTARIEEAKATGFLRYLNLAFLNEISEDMRN